MENNKTLTYLYSKGRNRFGKVVYLVFFLLIMIGWIYNASIEMGYKKPEISFYFWGIIITIAIFELIRRAFYYIALGTIRPKK